MKGFRYTIGTENKDHGPYNTSRALIEKVKEYLPCFTVTEGIGAWKGSLESSLAFDFTLDLQGQFGQGPFSNEFDCDARANFVASEIRAFNSQEAVILIKQPVEVFYIYT